MTKTAGQITDKKNYLQESTTKMFNMQECALLRSRERGEKRSQPTWLKKKAKLKWHALCLVKRVNKEYFVKSSGINSFYYFCGFGIQVQRVAFYMHDNLEGDLMHFCYRLRITRFT